RSTASAIGTRRAVGSRVRERSPAKSTMVVTPPNAAARLAGCGGWVITCGWPAHCSGTGMEMCACGSMPPGTTIVPRASTIRPESAASVPGQPSATILPFCTPMSSAPTPCGVTTCPSLMIRSSMMASPTGSRFPASLEPPHAGGARVALDWHIAERRRRGAVRAERGRHPVGHEQLRADLLVELLEARGQVHRVTDRGELLAPRRSHGPDHGRARVQPDADAQRPRPVPEPAPADLGEDLARGRHRVLRRVGVVERRAEHRHEPVAEELVHE